MKDGRKGCFYGLGTYPPGPLSYKERGSIACLMDENKGCFYGFERGRYAIKTRHIPSRKTDPRSPFLAGTGVAYNEA